MRRLVSPTHPYQDDSRGPRIQKVLADAGIGSRRACEESVEEGRVTVNGHRIDGLPAWVDPAKDHIKFDGRRIKAPERDIYVMLFKPKGYVSTNSDPERRPLAVDLVQHPSHARLYPVGRLDIDGSGLLLMTNDGAIANRLTHPRFEMYKGYEVMVSGRVEDSDIARLERSIFAPAVKGHEPDRASKSKLVILKRDAARTLLYMELREDGNRQVRDILATVGHPVKKLRRVRMGPLQLKGLQAGEWRELTPKELAVLKEHAFATPQERAARKEAEPDMAVRRAEARARKARPGAARRPEAARANRRGEGRNPPRKEETRARRGEGRHAPRKDDERGRRAAPRGEGRAAPRGEGRAAPRGEGRAAPRGEGRAAPRGEGRAAPRGEGRAAPRGEGRAAPRGEGRAAPRGEGRAAPRGEGRAAPRGEGRAAPRGKGRAGARVEAPVGRRGDTQPSTPRRGPTKPPRPPGPVKAPRAGGERNSRK